MESYERILLLKKLIDEGGFTGAPGPYRVGVDLGTADVVLVVTDEAGQPVAGAMRWASVVRDGLVVDFRGATLIVEELKRQVEGIIGAELSVGATAVPPGTVGRNAQACSYVIAGAGLDPATQMDEPVAAALALGVTDGVVVDIGGGTTGIAVLRGGQMVFSADEATGGTHLSLALAGAYHIPVEEAELIKRDPSRHKEIMPVVTPVIEKMASVTQQMMEKCGGCEQQDVYVVGGTAYLSGFENVFGKAFGRPVHVPPHPLLVTPLGIALY